MAQAGGSATQRERPNVLICGKPGTGKTTLASMVCTRMPTLRQVSVGQLVKEKGFHSGYDDAFDTFILDEQSEEKVRACVALRRCRTFARLSRRSSAPSDMRLAPPRRRA